MQVSVPLSELSVIVSADGILKSRNLDLTHKLFFSDKIYAVIDRLYFVYNKIKQIPTIAAMYITFYYICK